MPKMWNLQLIIIFSSRIECCPVPSWNMTGSSLKRGSKVMGLSRWGTKFKIIVWCLSWQQIKAMDSLNHLKLFEKHECLKKWSYLRKWSILGSERSNGSRKIHVRDIEGPYGHPPQNSPKSIFPIDFFMLFQIKHVARSKSQITWSSQRMSGWPPWKNAEKWKIWISITQQLIITDKHNLTINICFCGWKMQ